MYEAASKTVESKDAHDAHSKSTADYEVSVPIGKLQEYAGKGFVECEAIVASRNGHASRSICRMSYDEAIVLSELPSEHSTPVPLDLLFDDAALDLARGIRGGLVEINDERIYRTELAENAVYLIRKNFSDVRPQTMQRRWSCIDDRTDDDLTDTDVITLVRNRKDGRR